MKKINIYKNGELYDIIYGSNDDAILLIVKYQRNDKKENIYTWEFAE